MDYELVIAIRYHIKIGVIQDFGENILNHGDKVINDCINFSYDRILIRRES